MSTQTKHPWRTMLRTTVQVAIPVLILLGVIVPEVVQIVLEETGAAMPDQLRAILLAASAVTVALAAIVTRIMAIPRFDELLGRLRLTSWLAAEPRRDRGHVRGEGGIRIGNGGSRTIRDSGGYGFWRERDDDPNDVFPED